MPAAQVIIKWRNRLRIAMRAAPAVGAMLIAISKIVLSLSTQRPRRMHPIPGPGYAGAAA